MDESMDCSRKSTQSNNLVSFQISLCSTSCLHIEVASLGIDVVAVHPSPVASNFYANLDHKVDLIESAAKGAVPPSQLPDDIFRSIGGAALRDLGGMAWGTRMGTFWLPYNFFTQTFATLAPFMPDWKTHNQHR
jgi:NAD(P)-dependent dehydrogenase (short-subunit alcohol dehydrogenase family)